MDSSRIIFICEVIVTIAIGKVQITKRKAFRLLITQLIVSSTIFGILHHVHTAEIRV